MKTIKIFNEFPSAKFCYAIHGDPMVVNKVIISGQAGSGIFTPSGITIVDKDGNIDAPVTTTNLSTSGDTTLGDASGDTLTVPSTSQFNAPIVVGVDDTGYDVKLFGATSGSYMLWDESADKLIVNAGTADLGTSCEADAYTVGGAAGVDFNGAVTNLTVVKGIVTAAS